MISFQTRLLRIPVMALLAVTVFAGCDNDFSAKAEFEERVVVFSVLDRSAPYQVVRLDRTFDTERGSAGPIVPPAPVTEAVVSVSTDRRKFVFRDTIFTLADGSTRKVWINRELVPAEGTVYTLSVEVPGFGPITATTRVPSRAFARLAVVNGGVRVGAEQNTAYPASGYYFRLWVTGMKTVDGRQIDVRREVPQRYNAETGAEEFTEPTRDKAVVFSNGNLLRVHSQLREADSVSGSDVVGVAYSLDQYLYSYYKLARGFDDPVSVRQDRPDISNVVGGVGIFGAIYPDSVRSRFSAIVQK